MLDVDGHVIAAADLIQRVEQLVQEVNSKGLAGTESRAGGLPRASLQQRFRAMWDLHDQVWPPLVEPAHGLRSRAGRFAKRAVVRLTAWNVEPRWIVQRDYDAHNLEVAAALSHELEDLRQRTTTLRRQVVTSLERVNRVGSQQKLFMASVSENPQAAASRNEVRALRQEVEGVLARLGAASASGANINYVAFEERFRGAGSHIREAQERYVGMFPPAYVSGSIVDIGCGRGEMLELLREAGHEVMGVDLDADMIQVCGDKGLPVVRDDGIRVLERTEDNSLKGIFCAQVVEHLLTSEMERLVRLAFQKLKPEGVVIIETINPRSLFALANHFYADTSHVRPVHPETLRFICEQVGFGAARLEELSAHPMVGLADDLPEGQVGVAVDALLRSVFGYQDYAIIATK